MTCCAAVNEMLDAALWKEEAPALAGNARRFVSVCIGTAALCPEIYDVDVPYSSLTHIYNEMARCSASAQPVRTRFKRFAYRGATCECYENGDTRVYRDAIESLAAYPESATVAMRCVRERLPISAFPCTTDLDDRSYVKITSFRVASRKVVDLESAWSEDRDALYHRVHVRYDLPKTAFHKHHAWCTDPDARAAATLALSHVVQNVQRCKCDGARMQQNDEATDD